MAIITLEPGERLVVTLKDTDGMFEIHYDTLIYPGKLLIEEVEGLPDDFGAEGVLYESTFSNSEDEFKDI